MNIRAAAPLLVWAVTACHTPAPARTAASLPPMTFFGAEDPELAKVAQALNERVRARYPSGPSVTHSPVSLEEAQIAVGCVDATPACWEAVAKSVTADALLLAEVGAVKPAGVRLRVRIFDSRTRATLHVAERTSRTVDQALADVPQVVDELFAAPAR